MNLHLVAGKGGEGHVSQGGLGFDLIRIGASLYVKPGRAFYRKLRSPRAKKLRGRWLTGPVMIAQFTSQARLTELSKFVDGTLAKHGKLAKGEPTRVRGRRVIGVKDTTEGGVLYATVGKPYPVELT